LKLTFWGAAQTVTGSMHQLTVAGREYLLDCGMFQGKRQESRQRNCCPPIPPASLDAIFLSHAHIDHCGVLPVFVKDGFTGPIYTSPATADLCDPMLADSGFLQEKDAEYLNRRFWKRKALLGDGEKDGEVLPIYTAEDAARVQPLFSKVLLHTPTAVSDSVEYETFEAGHLLGSTSILLNLRENGNSVRLVFSGDVGRPDLPIIQDPEACPPCDYLILESTYGDRLHKDMHQVEDKLEKIIRRTAARGGKIIVPAFAVGRTQQLILLLHELADKMAIPDIPVFVDSPLAIKATRVHQAHSEVYDIETMKHLDGGHNPFTFGRVHYVEKAEDSKALNDLRGPMIIIASSGMAEAGRILHHLKNNIGSPRNTVLITGFQAQNTLGRRILEGEQDVRIFGEPHRVRAEVAKLNELSGHADQSGLLKWIEPVARGIKKIFLVHGELPVQQTLARVITERFGTEVAIPARGDKFEF
jgi:metallo-beta-lactamase family protein